MDKRSVICLLTNTVSASLLGSLEARGWKVLLAADCETAKHLIGRHAASVGVWIPDRFDEVAGRRFVSLLRGLPNMEWIGVFDRESVRFPDCQNLILDYLFDHHTLPLDVNRLVAAIGHAIGRAELLRAQTGLLPCPSEAHQIIGESTATSALIRLIRRVAASDATVLIRGESGTGKELVALNIHRFSPRSTQAFIALNCGSIPAQLIQSELFGHVKGAFTGAVRDHCGVIEAAHQGTLFLDEIGDLPPELQVNLLRFLQEGSIQRLGSTQTLKLSVRVLAATHVNLEEAVRAGRFREDLFHRINVLPIDISPLRARPEDIEPLARHFLSRFAFERGSRPLLGFSRAAVAAMLQHAWPGNVRELTNRIRRAVVLAEGRRIQAADLGLPDAVHLRTAELSGIRGDAERDAILSSLLANGNNVSRAARQLGVSRMTLYRLMAKHEIGPGVVSAPPKQS